jgi:hypothetical protein
MSGCDLRVRKGDFRHFGRKVNGGATAGDENTKVGVQRPREQMVLITQRAVELWVKSKSQDF